MANDPKNRVQGVSGALKKQLPDPTAYDLENMTEEQAMGELFMLYYLLMHGQFLSFNQATRMIQGSYYDLWDFIDPPTKDPKWRQSVKDFGNDLYHLEWSGVEANRQSVANKIFMEEFATSEFLLTAALNEVRSQKKDAIPTALKVMDYRAKLIGLYAPEKLDIGGSRHEELSDGRKAQLREAAQEAAQYEQDFLDEDLSHSDEMLEYIEEQNLLIDSDTED